MLFLFNEELKMFQRTLILTCLLILGLTAFYGLAKAQNPYSSSYQYLTLYETTSFGEVIKFWHEDTLYGPVHSNDTIAIMENPVFFDTVSTSAAGFWQGISYNPMFMVDPVFNAPRVYFPNLATEVREAAVQSGLFFDSQNGYYAHRLEFLDAQGWRMYRWEMGLPFDTLMAPLSTGLPLNDQAIFVDGYLELKGVFRGTGTVGARGYPEPGGAFLGYHCIRLMDDIRYYFANPVNGQFNDTTGGYTDMLAIVSESNITIANTWENGRNNSSQGSDIVITAAMAALGDDSLEHFWGSFSFEDQNEPLPSPYIWEFYTGNYNYESVDERGDIFRGGEGMSTAQIMAAPATAKATIMTADSGSSRPRTDSWRGISQTFTRLNSILGKFRFPSLIPKACC